jgi:hypothetical protein
MNKTLTEKIQVKSDGYIYDKNGLVIAKAIGLRQKFFDKAITELIEKAKKEGAREMAKDISESNIGTPRTTYKAFEAKAFYEGFKFGWESIKFIAKAKLEALTDPKPITKE